MIQCSKCKTELTESDVFCFVCGYKMEQKIISQPMASEWSAVLKPCPQCHTIPASAEDVFCAECGYRLIPEPIQKIVEKTEVKPTLKPDIQPQYNVQAEPITIAVPPHTQQPIQPVPHAQQTSQTISHFSHPKAKKRGAGKVIFKIFLILLIVVVVGGGVLSFLIYNGSVSREVVGNYIPKSMLDMIPSATGVASTSVTRYFVSYCFGQFDKATHGKRRQIEKSKEAVISDVYTNIDVGSETNDAAEVAFRKAGNEQLDKFSRFSNHFTVSFSSKIEAMEKRENIIKDLRLDDYRLEFIRVSK